METEDTEFKEGKGDDFTEYLFSSLPKEKNSIKVEFPLSAPIPIVQHIFQELLMIFTDGMKYLFGDREGGISITKLTNDDISLITKYIESIGFTLVLETFNVHDYLSNMKLPNYFLHPNEITPSTTLKDLYYETFLQNKIFRLSFDKNIV